MKKSLILSLSLIASLSLASCNGNNSSSLPPSSDSTSSETSSTGNSSDQTSSSREGLEGNQSADQVTAQTIDGLKELLIGASKLTKYSYDITSTVSGNEGHFVDYFDEDCWYNLDDNEENSFGLALDNTGRLFKYYLDENNNPTASLYRYTLVTTDGDPEIDNTLYGPLNLACINMLTEDVINDMEATKVSANRYLIQDGSVYSVFQYMTTYGTSIMNYMTATYVDVINVDTLEFKVTVELGSYGDFVCVFKPLTESPLDKTQALVASGDLVGIEYHEDVKDFFDLTASNNYTIGGIKTIAATGITTAEVANVYCTENYFYYEYTSAYSSYTNFGYAFVPANTEVEIISSDGTSTKQTLKYSACYEFEQGSDGSFYFDKFVGPLDDEDTPYLEIDGTIEDITNPSPDYLYIAKNKDTGVKEVYQYALSDGGSSYAFSRYSSWYQSVGEFDIGSNYSSFATFYLQPAGLSSYGMRYYEKGDSENQYVTSESAVTSNLGNGLYGWGFQSTSTWLDYIQSSFLNIEKDTNGNVVGGDVGLVVKASIDGGTAANQQIFYSFSNFNSTKSESVESFLTAKGVQF